MKTSNVPGVFIGIPHTKPIAGETIDSLMGTTTGGNIAFQRAHNMPIDQAREYLGQFYLDHTAAEDFPFFLLADADASWKEGSVTRLLSHERAFVAGCMYRRRLPSFPTLGTYLGEEGRGIHVYSFKKSVEMITKIAREHDLMNSAWDEHVLPEPMLEEFDGTGMHFVLIRRDVLRAIPSPWWKANPVHKSGEDFYFCRKVKAAGYKIMADLSVHTGHIVGDNITFGVREMMAFIDFDKDQMEKANMEVRLYD